MTLSMDELASRQERFWKRTAQYLGHGHDRFAAAAFVAEAAGAGPGQALDVGTGKGLMAMALVRRNFHVTSVDVDPDEQALAAELARKADVDGRIAFERADASRLPYPDGRFDVVACMDALHHFESGEPVLREMARILKPSGRLVLADFSEAGFALVERIHSAEGHLHPRGAVTMAWALEFLEGIGFFLMDRSSGHLQDRALLQRGAASASEGDTPR
ncbi:MAG: class I SAM-dependent methyltransferase [Acidobacteriota bacterium]